MKSTFIVPGAAWRTMLPAALLAMAAATQIQAAELTAYGAFKVRNHQQSGPLPGNVPAVSSHGYYAFAVQSEEDAVLFGMITSSAQLPLFVAPGGNDPLVLESQSDYSTQAELNSALPNGNLNFAFTTGTGGNLAASISLTGDAYPAAPALDNYTAAQDIDATKAFTLTWTKAPTLGASDFVLVTIYEDGDPIHGSAQPWEAGALDGTKTSFTIPANTLNPNTDITAGIVFIKVTQSNTTGIPGAIGRTGYAANTEIPLTLHTSGGGPDTSKPSLVSSIPNMGATGVSANASVIFQFNEAMKPQQQINWVGVANSGAFVYNWSGDAKSLTCTLPGGFTAGSMVTWQLVPNGFSDLAGNTLNTGNSAGFFTVATGGGPGNCEGSPTDRKDTFLIGRSINYNQATAGAPTVAPAGNPEDPAASFIATVSPVNVSLTKAEVVIPGGARKTLTSAFSVYFFQQVFNTETEMNTAYPNGAYTADLTLAGGGNAAVTVNLGAGPNVPHCSNFTPAQAIDPAADFVLSWDALTGATANDFIEITIKDPQGKVILHLPDPCANPPKPLATTATSVTIPANLLKPATTYPVELSFFRTSEAKTNSNPTFTAVAGNIRMTRFNIKTIGGTPNVVPVITGYRIAADGRFEADVTGSVGRTIKLEASDSLSTWATVGSGLVPASGKVTVRDSRLANLSVQGYRAKSE